MEAQKLRVYLMHEVGWADKDYESRGCCMMGFYLDSSKTISESYSILCASRNPTSPSRTSSCTKVAQDGAKLAPNWVQKSTKNGVPHRTWGPKMGYPIGPGTNNSKKSIQKSNATKKRAASHSLPPFEPKKWPTWPQVELQNRSKIDKKSMQQSIVLLIPLGVDL